MLTRGKMERGVVEIVDMESLVPKEHLLRKIDAAVNWEQVYGMVEELYCEGNGRPGIDPVALFKMVLIQHLYGLPSLRRTAEEINGSIYYRWFLGYTLSEETPHYSTVSYNFRHRFAGETIGRIFGYWKRPQERDIYIRKPYSSTARISKQAQISTARLRKRYLKQRCATGRNCWPTEKPTRSRPLRRTTANLPSRRSTTAPPERS